MANPLGIVALLFLLSIAQAAAFGQSLSRELSHLKLDGSFHRIKLDSPVRGGEIIARSGYYASR